MLNAIFLATLYDIYCFVSKAIGEGIVITDKYFCSKAEEEVGSLVVIKFKIHNYYTLYIHFISACCLL